MSRKAAYRSFRVLLVKGATIKIMDSSLICHPKLVEHFRQLAKREGISHQMEILPRGGTDAGEVQRLHGGIPSITLSIPTCYVHTPNEMVNASDVQACTDLLAQLPGRSSHRRLRPVIQSLISKGA